MEDTLSLLVTRINAVLGDYILVILLFAAAVYFSVKTCFVQFRMIGEMLRLLVRSGKKDNDTRTAGIESHKSISSFQAFTVSIASRVGTGNLAGVASAIAIGGPGAIFWMWLIALLGAATSFIESTLAQLFKVRGDNSFRGGPAYYILKGIHKRWWAVTFAVLITLTFGLAFNSVQSNTISHAFANSFGISHDLTAMVLMVLTLVIIWGGIRRISQFSQVIVPAMAVIYILLAIVVIGMNITRLPEILAMVLRNAFGFDQLMGGTVGTAISMGIKRGLFSNEAGEGSAPNVAATASVSHPVKQGLIQAFGVFTDTLIICSCTAFIILCSGVVEQGHDGIILTQHALDAEFGGHNFGSVFVSVAIFFFAFTSIVANYYYGETNLRFIRNSNLVINIYRLTVGVIVYLGAVSSLDLVWGFADITMAMMTVCNLCAIAVLSRYALICLKDYTAQRKKGIDPIYHSSTIPEIASETECWD